MGWSHGRMGRLALLPMLLRVSYTHSSVLVKKKKKKKKEEEKEKEAEVETEVNGSRAGVLLKNSSQKVIIDCVQL